MYLRNMKSSAFKKDKEVPKEKSHDSNLTNLLTLNNFIHFSDRISKLEQENETFQKQNKQIIEKFDLEIGNWELENDGLKKSLRTSKIQKLKLEREHVVFQAQYIYQDSKLLLSH